jgi:hypothetical protein
VKIHTRFLLLPAALLLGLATIAVAQKWEYLGEANVDGAIDHDRIMVTPKANTVRFRSA